MLSNANLVGIVKGETVRQKFGAVEFDVEVFRKNYAPKWTLAVTNFITVAWPHVSP